MVFKDPTRSDRWFPPPALISSSLHVAVVVRHPRVVVVVVQVGDGRDVLHLLRFELLLADLAATAADPFLNVMRQENVGRNNVFFGKLPHKFVV
jgi:hypothetical protein